jgi:hypothetical protein
LKLQAATETPVSTAHTKILKLDRKTLINGKIVSVLERLKPICYHDPHHPALFRNRRQLRAILEEVIPGISPSQEEPEF